MTAMTAIIFGLFGVITGWIGCAIWGLLQTDDVFYAGYRQGYADGMKDRRTGRPVSDWGTP